MGKRPVRAGLMAMMLAGTAIGLSVPVAAQAQGTQATQKLAIPSQPLAGALVAFSRQTGIQIVIDSAVASGRNSTAINGDLVPMEALRRLLAGTGLEPVVTSPGNVAIRPAGTGPIITGTLRVEDGLERAGGPVLGYRATRSATATKTDTALRDVPQSVQVVPRDVITERQAVSLSEVVTNISNVRQSSTSGNRAENFNLRGFATTGYAIDGVVLNPTLDRPETFLDLANVERVEVLKGPASVLYGRGDPGGLINIVTRRPEAGFAADAGIQVGSFGFVRGEGSVTGALNESGTLTARATGAAQREKGFRDQGSTDSERQFGALALRWSPGTDTVIDANIDYTNQEVPFDRGLPVTADNEVSLPRDRFLSEEWSKVEAWKLRMALSGEHQANDWLKLRATTRYDKADVQDTGIDYRSLGSDGRTLSRRYTDRREQSEHIDLQMEAVADFTTGAIGHTVLAGAEYAHSDFRFDSARANIASIDIYNPVYGAPMPAATPNSAYDGDVDLYSAYLQDQIDLSEQWKLLAGVRYDHVKQKQIADDGAEEPRIDKGSASARFGVVYRPVEPLSLYASFSQSFSPQSGMDENGEALAPEEGEQYEIGAKIDLIPDRLTLTAALFEITKTNVATADPRNPDADYSILTGEQRVRGGEVDISGTLAPGWRVIASFGYLDAEVTEDEVIAVGNKLGGVPRYSGSLWLAHDVLEGTLTGLSLGAGITAVDGRPGDLENSFDVDGYYRIDATASYPVTERLFLSVTGKNLTDEHYIASPVSRTENHAGAPRSVLVGLKAMF